MTKLYEKLEQTECNSLEGKTIKTAITERGCYFLLFEDGTWCCTHQEYCIGDILEDFQSEMEYIPFVELGLVTVEEVEKHWEELDAYYEDQKITSRRELYEQLHAEFGKE